jgi:hypothetical protein
VVRPRRAADAGRRRVEGKQARRGERHWRGMARVLVGRSPGGHG